MSGLTLWANQFMVSALRQNPQPGLTACLIERVRRAKPRLWRGFLWSGAVWRPSGLPEALSGLSTRCCPAASLTAVCRVHPNHRASAMNPFIPIPDWAVMAAHVPCHAATFFRDFSGRFRLANGRFAPRWQTRSLEPNAAPAATSRRGNILLIDKDKGGL